MNVAQDGCAVDGGVTPAGYDVRVATCFKALHCKATGFHNMDDERAISDRVGTVLRQHDRR